MSSRTPITLFRSYVMAHRDQPIEMLERLEIGADLEAQSLARGINAMARVKDVPGLITGTLFLFHVEMHVMCIQVELVEHPDYERKVHRATNPTCQHFVDHLYDLANKYQPEGVVRLAVLPEQEGEWLMYCCPAKR